jgi:(S)-ureidoglycine aminohydrolase
MPNSTYYSALGGLPPQSQLLSGRAIFTTSYAVIPKGVMQDIVTSYLPYWAKTRCWIIARPLSGFAETFSQYIMDVSPGGGSMRPDNNLNAEAVLFVVSGESTLSFGGADHKLVPGSYVYLPAATAWGLHNHGSEACRFHWIRKAYEPIVTNWHRDDTDPLSAPLQAFVTHESKATVVSMPGTNGAWSTTRFVDPEDLRHDMHVNIVNFQPGGVIPFMETHVMEHGLYVLAGKAVYRLNNDWVEVEAGDFMWLRAFCPQACYAGGPGPFRYLLYKDVNRHPKLSVRG